MHSVSKPVPLPLRPRFQALRERLRKALAQPSQSDLEVAHGFVRTLFGLTVLFSPVVLAADYPGKALFDYAAPFVIFLGLAAICMSVVAALFKPEYAKGALYAAVLMVVLFTIIKTAPALVSAVQG